jgi:hypothetical protein
MILDIYSRIALPWCFVYSVAATTLARFPKIMVTYLAQIVESDIPGILYHLYKYIFYFGHIMYSIISDIIVKSFFWSGVMISKAKTAL